MTVKGEIIIHVGYPKTGTTTLQKHFFPFIDEIDYLGKFDDEGSMFSFNKNMINELIFNDQLLGVDKFLSTLPEFKKSLLSEESFLSNTLRVSRINGADVVADPHTLIKNLRNTFEKSRCDVKVIITIRRQDEMLLSLYAQSYTHYYSGQKRFNTFDKFLDFFDKEKKGLNLYSSLDYLKMADLFSDAFGEENVSILAFEHLERDPLSFHIKLCNFLQVDPNKYKADYSLQKENARSSERNGYKRTRNESMFYYLKRMKRRLIPNLNIQLNKFIGDYLKSVRVPNFWIDRTIKLTKQQRKKILASYAESNRAVSMRFDLSLDKSGYYE